MEMHACVEVLAKIYETTKGPKCFKRKSIYFIFAMVVVVVGGGGICSTVFSIVIVWFDSVHVKYRSVMTIAWFKLNKLLNCFCWCGSCCHCHCRYLFTSRYDYFCYRSIHFAQLNALCKLCLSLVVRFRNECFIVYHLTIEKLCGLTPYKCNN